MAVWERCLPLQCPLLSLLCWWPGGGATVTVEAERAGASSRG